MNDKPIDYEKQERVWKILRRVTIAGLLAMNKSKPKR